MIILGTAIKDVTITVSDYANWNYALPFTTDYSGGSALEDWNMLVRLSEDSSNGAGNAGFRYSQARSNGGDLRFIDKSGSELKYEIAKWNPSGESQIWVNVPALKSDANYHVLGQPQCRPARLCQQWIGLGRILWGLPPRRNHRKCSGFKPLGQQPTRSQCPCTGEQRIGRSRLLFD